MTSLATEIVEGASALRAIAAEWDAAIPQSFTATLSQSAWYFAWQDAFPPKKLVLVTARREGRLLGLLPLSLVKTDARGLFFSQVTTFARGDYQTPVLAPGASPDVLPVLVDAALKHFGRRFVYWWACIPVTNPAADAIKSHLRARGMAVAEQFNVAPRLHIGGRSYSEVEASWSPSHRTDVRRQSKRLAAVDKLSLWEPQDLPEARALLQEFFRVHDEKWLSQGQPGRFQNATERKHFAAIVDRMWGRGLHFSVLRCGPANVSYGLGFLSDGWIQWYRPTYRRDYQNLSPGKVHLALLVQEACARGLKGVDFLQGPEGYKLQWSNELLRIVDLYASFRAWSPAYQWFTRGKPFVRDRLGPAAAHLKVRLQTLRQRFRGR